MQILERKKVGFSLCERYALTTNMSELTKQFQVEQVHCNQANRNHFLPTQTVPVIINRRGYKAIDDFRWGLYPFWAKDSVNAHSHSVLDKEFFGRMLNKQRCVIPCDAFYGWDTTEKDRQPIRIGLSTEKAFGIAGIYDIWKHPGGEEIRSFTMLTTWPNRVVSQYNTSMPVILNEELMDVWLNNEKLEEYRYDRLFQPHDPQLMVANRVGFEESNGQFDDKEHNRSGWALVKH